MEYHSKFHRHQWSIFRQPLSENLFIIFSLFLGWSIDRVHRGSPWTPIALEGWCWPGISVFWVNPGFHMPPTYLGHSRRHSLGHQYRICENLSPNCNLSQAMTAGLPAKLSCVQAGGCQRLSVMKIFYVNFICGRNEWRNNSIFPTIPYLLM